MTSSALSKTKSSGIPWLSDVPAHWKVKRLKYGLILSNDRLEVDQEMSLPYVGMENIESCTGKLLPLDDEFVPTGTSNRFRKGQVLFGKLRPYLAKATIADRTGVCSTELMVFEPTQFDSHFLLYLVLSDGFIKLVDASTQGSKMPRADWEFISNIEVAFPPLPEQRAIAAFLDERTARIDGLVERKRRLVQLLKEKRQALITCAVTRGLDANVKLKPSGVPWLGDVPEGWEVKRMAYLGRFGKGRGIARADITDEGVPAVLYGDLYTRYDHKAEVLVKHTTPEVAEGAVEIKRGDLLLTGSGETKEDIGKCIVYLGNEKAFAGGDVIILRQDKADSEFLSFVLNCGYVVAQKTMMAKGDIVVHIYSSDLRNVILSLPPLTEQVAIVSFLNKRTAQIDLLITKVEKAIERLREYRTALISAAVTGKVKVA